MHVQFIDQTLRDGQQSLWGLRMRAHQATPALGHIDRTGFRVVDLTGAGMFQVLTRTFADDPWESTDILINGMPGSGTRAALRTISVVGMGFAPDAIIDLWVRTFVKHGIKSFWIYDCLYDMPVMKRLADVILDAGADVAPAIMYGLTPVHDDAFFAEKAREISSWPGVKTVYVEDAPGVLTPERARTLLPALQQATGETPIELHVHNTTGLAPLVYIEGLNCGIDILHTASRPMANGPSLPATEDMIEILDMLGHTHSLDTKQLEPVADHFEAEAIRSGYELGVPNPYSLRPYQHQLPGGMTGTLKSQLAQHGMEERLNEVLQETMLVREELGEPIMATPFSQFVGIQAVLNIVTGDRYAVVPDEVIQYAHGHYGPLARPIEPEAADRIFAAPRAKHFATWERPQPTLKEIRDGFGRQISDEELLLRWSMSDAEVDRTIASGSVSRKSRAYTPDLVREVSELLAGAKRLRRASVQLPGLSVSVGRQ
ncbi:MAG TPA: hypothetical protein VHX88_11685 [Solirubrobacteraceae bacterium]|jgi:oxaloacetate decarboxylase alpha subunit|nr:hypothetical protein [Solirubrobacteraceae bacterium]